MTWKAGDEGTTRGYKFTYDGLDRLMNATYGEGTAINTNTNRFNENVTGYDKNGNIKNLQRYGQTSPSAYGMIDNLTYTLTGNRLNRVDDSVTGSAYNNGFEFKNGASVADEYAYDTNGNLTKYFNKGIKEIQYNVLNLPDSISFSDVAAKPSKSDLTAVGRALKKHGDRVGSLFPQARGNQAAINTQGKKVLNDILTNPNVQGTINTTKVGRYGGNVVDYRIPGGKGVRYNANENEFIGFLEP